jgi:cysteine sulfinate desulfinase/cysteine desulfurase-like protein
LSPGPLADALGLSAEQAHCTVRFSLGVGNTEAEVDHVLECLDEVLRETMSAIQFVGCR